MQDQSPHFAEARARHALRAAGLPFDGSLDRASSTRNEVYLSDEVVVRINRQPNQRLRREAMLYGFLPDKPWAPTGVHWGGELGADYLIVERKPGGPLAHAWPNMSKAQRRTAIRDLADALIALHRTSTPTSVPRLEVATHFIDPRCVTPLAPLFVEIERLRANPSVDRGLMDDVDDIVTSTAEVLNDFDQRTLIHGDLTFENILWDGEKVSGLLDFEWCRGASNDMDLDVLLRCCAFPEAHIDPVHAARTKAADYIDIPVWLAEDRPDLFDHPDLADRLRLYCLAFDVRDLVESLPVQLNEREPMHPINRLRSLVSTGAHLSTMLNRIGVPV